jgi:hypothetical protein
MVRTHTRSISTPSLAALLLGSALAAQVTPTFTEQIAPIVFGHCARCHRAGEVAPFPLLSYADCKKRGANIATVVTERYMPPWHPEPGHGEFRGSLRLSDAEVAAVKAWVDGGMPEGPADKLPPLPSFPSGWQLGEPDLVLEMPVGFPVPAAGRDLYRNFVLPVGLPEDRWITAIEVRPSARSVLHHILFFLDDSGEAAAADGKDGKAGFAGMRLRRAGVVGGWAVGGMPELLPDGLGIHLPKGNDLVLQSHFHPTGKAATEKTVIGLHFAKAPPSRTLVPIQLPPFFGFASNLQLPAGNRHVVLADQMQLPCDVDAVTVGGHAHMLCTTQRLWATLPDGSEQRLFKIGDWDFNWQNRYTYTQLVRIPKGAVLHSELVYDNSADNKSNPNKPPKDVRWGRESTDEMGSITLMVVAADEQDTALLQNAVRSKNAAQAVSAVEGSIAERWQQFDKNGDGKITRDELPPRLRRFFDLLDADHDGALTKDELKAFVGALGGDASGVPKPDKAPEKPAEKPPAKKDGK